MAGLPRSWKRTQIGSVCDVVRGSSPRPIADQRYFDGGTIPWIKIADATKSGRYLYDTREKVNEFGASFSRLLPKGSLIVAASGTLGYTQMLGVPGCIHDGWLHLSSFRGVDKLFLYYWLKCQVQHFTSSAYGAAIQNINTAIMRESVIDLPSVDDQHRIASILSAYDDLIENNTRRIAILEEMARRIYEEWFVRFRFPGHEGVRMVESELGLVPEGWRLRALGDLVDDIRDGVDPNAVAPETPYVGLEHIPRRSIALVEWGQAADVGSTKLRFREGDILFGKIRPYFHKVAVAPVAGVASSDAIVMRAKQAQDFGLALAVASSDAFVAHATQTSNGTKMPRANWGVLRQYPVPTPPPALHKRFEEFMAGVVSAVANHVLRNRNLRVTRDLLLPKLVSGELDVSALPEPEALAA